MKKILFSSLLFNIVLFAAPKVGDHFPRLHLKDQFGTQIDITPDERYIVMAFEKGVSVDTAALFSKHPKGYLSSHHLRYISDISAMPSFITKLFALPKMKKYPFSVLLINDERGKQFDKQTGKLTLYTLKKRIITSIKFIKPSELETILK